VQPVVLRDHVLVRSYYAVASQGTGIKEIATRAGLPWDGRVWRAGDLLRDNRIDETTLVDGGELIHHSAAPEPPINPSACIRCGWCVDACPTRVQPASVLDACQTNNHEMAERGGIDACIECGICSYVCPSRLPLLEGIRAMNRTRGTIRIS
jgi:electron transport complex protein RnfC